MADFPHPGSQVVLPKDCTHSDPLVWCEECVKPWRLQGEPIPADLKLPVLQAELAANKRRADAGRAALVASVTHGGTDLGETLETIATDTFANILHYLDVRSDFTADLFNKAMQTYLGDQEDK